MVSVGVVRVEATRVWNRANKMVREDGAGRTAGFFAGQAWEHATLPLLRRRRAEARFTFDGAELPYEYSLYGQTWRNERTIEIAIARHFLAARDAGRMLEVGNVLSHYGIHGHDVLDRYERAVPGVLNDDVITFDPETRYDTIVSISTLEHVRCDEEEKDPRGSTKALGNLRRLLAPGGRMLVTVPVDWHAGLDADLASGRFALDRGTFYRRTTRFDWVVAEPEEALAMRYGSPYEAANGLFVTTTP
ncbi:methyltransferase domain-containing protein [Actinomycetospora chibensis]|uniref:Methyltransferase domain-containing protein n=1 Tax=Actinomycetospora chibensis TaxID=663606 RepID=A0ABV9RLB3_9PSEU|nr:methyltransferase domain-containing protein [Actinomycetospora chibensis]MDD7922510.1 methyltransferase domain-containing protein [Actinomycetospora chibensis]